MSEVRKWLEAIGLAQYAEAFEANNIEADLLGQVEDQTLKDIGVSSAGHRLRIRNAIAKRSPAVPVATNERAFAPAMEPQARDTAERRQVTVMFSDLVGSTALSARMDPEDLRDVISAYQKCVAATVGRFGGFVAKFMGDGVLIYFGYPQAHEDDAERAVRAGLELVAAVHRHEKTRRADHVLGVTADDAEIGDHLAPPWLGYTAAGLLDHTHEVVAWCERQWAFEVRIASTPNEGIGKAGARHRGGSAVPLVPGPQGRRTGRYGCVAKAWGYHSDQNAGRRVAYAELALWLGAPI